MGLTSTHACGRNTRAHLPFMKRTPFCVSRNILYDPATGQGRLSCDVRLRADMNAAAPVHVDPATPKTNQQGDFLPPLFGGG